MQMFGISCGKHYRPQFSAVPSQINLQLINIIITKYNHGRDFHLYHLLLVVVIKIMKKDNKSTDFDCSRLSDSTATCYISSARWLRGILWLWGISFPTLKAFISCSLIYRVCALSRNKNKIKNCATVKVKILGSCRG